jgi:hypothetical protein
MKLKLLRRFFADDYTIGTLYIDDKPFCDTLENQDRLLHQNMPLDVLDRHKTAGKTAIPIGTYKVNMNTVSPKYQAMGKYSDIGFKVPRLENVPVFDGILIHIGNFPKDTLGCVLVGKNTVKGAVMESTVTFNALYKLLKEAEYKGETIMLDIQYKDWEYNVPK